MFQLTRREQLLILFVLGALVLGAAVRDWRDKHRETPVAAEEAAVQ